MEKQIIYNPISGCLIISDEEIIKLTNIKNKIMNLLVKNMGKLTKTEEIWKLIAYNSDDVFDSYSRSYINTNIFRLRKKINKYFDIFSRQGYGYILVKKGQYIKDENCIIL